MKKNSGGEGSSSCERNRNKKKIGLDRIWGTAVTKAIDYVRGIYRDLVRMAENQTSKSGQYCFSLLSISISIETFSRSTLFVHLPESLFQRGRRELALIWLSCRFVQFELIKWNCLGIFSECSSPNWEWMRAEGVAIGRRMGQNEGEIKKKVLIFYVIARINK